MPDSPDDPPAAAVESFIARWKNSGAAERANAQLFLSEFCDLLSLPHPDPAQPDDSLNAYVFERNVHRPRPDGTVTTGRIDLYRRRAFVLETKQGVENTDAAKLGHGKRGSAAWDLSLEKAYHQACGYVKDLPSGEGRPPFVIVCDVGHCFELYSEFTCTGGTYVRFPDPHRHRITLDDLQLQAVRDRLRALWLDPLSLDPARQAARVTREIAAVLARLATSLEADGHDPQIVASFLQRCLFSLFAEDTGLLPERAFTSVIERCLSHPQGQVAFFTQMWREMDRGIEFSTLLHDRIRRFNGEFFRHHNALPLRKDQLQLLADASKADWTTVEPAIFGTLLERALDPATRHKLGAHYTPRAYVERLVFPTVIQPLRAEWDSVKAAAAVSVLAADELRQRIDDSPPTAEHRLKWIADEKKLRQAAAAPLIAFQKRLADVRVLDPACGSGNFLYVTFEHLKRLEGEVLELEETILSDRAQLDMDVTRVHPSHFLGLELNPRAAALAELVLWIGYLQWQHRSGKFLPDDPVLSSTRSVQHADAVLAHDGWEAVKDANGHPLHRWDGRTMKKHPVTGEDVPDESATAAVLRPVNPKPAPPWPEADYIVGNPPFIGASRMRDALGDGYTEALRKCWPAVPDSADFVMYWWHRAASLVRQGKVKRFGLITTNSITQTFNRRVVEAHMAGELPEQEKTVARPSRPDPPASGAPPSASTDKAGTALLLAFAIPDHPWVDSADGAAVRIAMTVGTAAASGDPQPGTLAKVIAEHETAEESEGVEVTLRETVGEIYADLTNGADVASAKALKSNAGLSSRGITVMGDGLLIDEAKAKDLGWTRLPSLAEHVRPYFNGKDLTAKPRGLYLLDLLGLTEQDVFLRYPEVYQWLLQTVKPERDAKAHTPDGAAYAKLWWLPAKPRLELRPILAELPRYIVTPMTAKHRTFLFLDKSSLPDQGLIAFGMSDALHLGLLSSIVHTEWALSVGGWLGVGNDPRYNNSRCFETFPFPALAPDSELAVRIRTLGEQLDAHRKSRQALHPGLTLTGMYNVLTKLRGGDPLTAKEKVIHEQGLVSVLQKLHDDLDRAVLDAYGWTDIEPAYAPAEHIGMAYHDCLQPGDPHPDEPGTLRGDIRETILTRLAALNKERAAEESAGHIRYLRPDFQAPEKPQAPAPGRSTGMAKPARVSSNSEEEPNTASLRHDRAPEAAAPRTNPAKLPWPADLPSQATAVRQQLATFTQGATVAQLSTRFSKVPKPALTQILETLSALGQASVEGETFRAS